MGGSRWQCRLLREWSEWPLGGQDTYGEQPRACLAAQGLYRGTVWRGFMQHGRTQAANAARGLNGEPSLILIHTAIRQVPPSAVAQRCGRSGAESVEWAPSLLTCFRQRVLLATLAGQPAKTVPATSGEGLSAD